MKNKILKTTLISLFSFLLIGCTSINASIGENGNWFINGEDVGIPAQGDKGETGNGIASITKTGTNGNVDTYTITYTDGSTTIFTVTNGENGIQGIQGEKGEDGHTPVITIGSDGCWYIDGVSTGIKAQGETGNGIASITKTGTDGNIDTYTITYTNGTTSTFTITNGEDGSQGIQGEKGEDGHTPIITIGSDGYWYIDGVSTGIKAQGEKGDKGDKGDTGNGISSIIKTSSNGNVDTYTITYTDGSTTVFTVTNGENGIQGIQGIPGEDGHTPIITIGSDGYWYIDGVSTGIKAQGEKGETGNGISSISKTSSVGNVDIYTITYTDGTTTIFTVTNGVDGKQGIQGVPGEDGHTPIITIGSDGCWYIDGVSTGIKAQGEKGEKGDKGDKGNGITSITKTDSIDNVDIYTILYDDGSSSIFTITNGEDGAQGIQGIPGEDGHTPVITIGDNGNWFVDGVDTGVKAKGEKGETGNGIKDVTTHYETDEEGNNYIVFTFYFTDESVEPVVQKVLLEKKIVNGGSLVDKEYILLNEGEDNYKFNIRVGYDDCSSGIIELDEKYILTNEVDFYVPGVYELEYLFLGELFNYDIVVISEEAKEYRDALIKEIQEQYLTIEGLNYIEKRTFEEMVEDLYYLVDISDMEELKSDIVSYLFELGYSDGIIQRPYSVDATIAINFFNANDPSEVQEQSMIYYKEKYSPSTAIEYTYNDEQFDVLVSESGVVTEVKTDPLYGQMVYIKGTSGVTYIYGSLADVQVNVGDNVTRGSKIAVAGTNVITESLGNHLHFGMVVDSNNVDPEDYFS